MDGSQEIIPLESAAMNESPASSILVVSADAETSAQAQQVLSDEIYDVTVVNDGSKALEQAAAMEGACELILLDPRDHRRRRRFVRAFRGPSPWRRSPATGAWTTNAFFPMGQTAARRRQCLRNDPD